MNDLQSGASKKAGMTADQIAIIARLKANYAQLDLRPELRGTTLSQEDFENLCVVLAMLYTPEFSVDLYTVNSQPRVRACGNCRFCVVRTLWPAQVAAFPSHD